MDILYPEADFSSPAFEALRSRRDGDGGLSPGRLVFADDLEVFGGRPFPELLHGLFGKEPKKAENVGGPSVVSLIHAAQMLEGLPVRVSFHGSRGDDALGERLETLLGRTPLDLADFRPREGRTPSTWVLSDPRWAGGGGERCFVNEIGSADSFGPAELGSSFLDADIVAFGGSALVPALHEGLPNLLAAARAGGALTLVNTVYDFRNERRFPFSPWPLGGQGGNPLPGPEKSYRNCDVLLMDREEALRLSGESSLGAAVRFFAASGTGAFVITQGPEAVVAAAGVGRFAPLKPCIVPVIDRETALSAVRSAGFEGAPSHGDTTGCGDAFAGGFIASIAVQLLRGGNRLLDLAEAVGWGIAGGAFTLSILGGTYFESCPGDKRAVVEAIHGKLPRQAALPFKDSEHA